jgi:hypothetical protein
MNEMMKHVKRDARMARQGWQRAAIVILMLLSAVAPGLSQRAEAQDAQPLELGTPLEVSFSDKVSSAQFTLTLEAGTTIYAAAYEPNFLLTLEISLVEPNGVTIAQAYPNALGTVLPPVTAASAGVYTLIVSQPDWATSRDGAFTLTVDEAEIAPVKPDGIYTGRLNGAGDVNFFSYTGPQYELFSLELLGSGTAFFMLNSDNSGLIRTDAADRAARPFNSLPAEGTFVAFAQTVEAAGSDYTLTLRPIAPVKVAPGETIAGNYTEARVPVLLLDSKAGQAWRITTATASENLSDSLQIFAVTDPINPVGVDYGSGPGGQPQFDPFVAPVEGQYLIVALLEDFSLDARELDYSITVTETERLTLIPGERLEATLAVDQGIVTYFYDGTAGQMIRLTFAQRGATGELGLRLLSAQDEVVTFTGRGGRSAVIEAVLPLDGEYRVEVSNIAYEPAPLDYALTLEIIE